jgi:hypothetical protein
MLVLVPTEEQQAACEMFAGGGDLALVAGAGASRTATLVLMAATTRRRGMYLAVNRAIADDARQRFGPNVTCSPGPDRQGISPVGAVLEGCPPRCLDRPFFTHQSDIWANKVHMA